MTDDLPLLAAKLTVAQRDAILALHDSAWRTWPESRFSAMLEGLGHCGLATLRDIGLASSGHPGWRLTPLGLALRQYLLSQGQQTHE